MTWRNPDKYETLPACAGGSVDLGRAVYDGGMTCGANPLMVRLRVRGMPNGWFPVSGYKSTIKLKADLDEAVDGFIPVDIVLACYESHYRAAQDKLDKIGELLSGNGCDCECDCAAYSSNHGPDCEPCLACRVDEALWGVR